MASRDVSGRPAVACALLRDFTEHLFSAELEQRLRRVARVLDDDPRTRFGDAPGYFSIPVPDNQDAKLWRFHHGNGRRLLMTVPPYLARNAKELLLPHEVVNRDAVSPTIDK